MPSQWDQRSGQSGLEVDSTRKELLSVVLKKKIDSMLRGLGHASKAAGVARVMKWGVMCLDRASGL